MNYGQFALYAALGFAGIQSFLPIIGYKFNNVYAIASARPAFYGHFFCVCCAYFFLTMSFVNNDFTNLYVAANSHPDLPLPYRLCAAWGAHEGSILFWILILNIWTLVFAFRSTISKNVVLTIAILGMLSFSFLIFLIFTSNPFLISATPFVPTDLNPLLQDPGFVLHPPMLYMGYVGLSLAFAITLANLLTKEISHCWARQTRQYTIAAWCFLTLGIMLGSWWAYRVLGWGGFWFWDPVENASLLPWLASTALIHLLLLVERRRALVSWTCLVALITFSLSILGTFLVRSGVLVSTHTFANDPSRGVFLLSLLSIFYLLVITIYLSRIKHVVQVPYVFPLFSRESKLFFNSALLILAMLTVLLGTIYPILIEALNLGSLSVGAPYFNEVMLPIVLFALISMGSVPFATWSNTKNSSVNNIYKPLLSFFICALFAGLFLIIYRFDLMTWLCLSLCLWMVYNLRKASKQTAMLIAHLGFGLTIIGIILSSSMSIERFVQINPGSATHVGPYQFFFITTERADGPNYQGLRATFEVLKNRRHIAYLYPEKRVYRVRDMVMSKVDIHAAIFRDLYIALGEAMQQQAWSVRIYYKPFIRFIWFGGLLMIVGGIFTFRGQRRMLNS